MILLSWLMWRSGNDSNINMKIPMDKKPSSINLLQNQMAYEYQSQMQKLISPLSNSTLGYIKGLNPSPMLSSSLLEQSNSMTLHNSVLGLVKGLNLSPMLSSSLLEQSNSMTLHNSVLGLIKGLKPNSMLSISLLAQNNSMMLSNSTLGLINSLKHHRLLQEQMEKYREPQLRLQGMIFSSNISILEQMKNALKTQSFLQEQIGLMNDVSINNDGTFSIENETISAESVSACINSIFIDDECNIDFIEQLKKLSSPTRSVVLCLLSLVIIPYIVAICANLTTPFWEGLQKESTSSEPRIAKKEIIREVNEIYSAEYLQDYRFVSTKNLSVHTLGNKNAEIIDELYLGKTVRLIEKSKSWFLIEYQDSDTNELKQGWVFSRYLSRFNK